MGGRSGVTKKAGLTSSCLVLVALFLQPAHAIDNSPTARLTRLADCIGDAGDMKGARRESFMNVCLAAKARAAGDPDTQQLLSPAVVMPASSTGLPAQERVLTCAAASRNMVGAQRTSYLKDCLAGRAPAPDAATKLAERKSACLAQAQGQPDTTRLAFLDVCLAAAATAATPVAAAPTDSEPRRRAACNVMAGARQGKARDGFIEHCAAAKPAAVKVAGPAARVDERSGAARLLLSKHCADEAHAKGVRGAGIAADINACLLAGQAGRPAARP